MFSTLAAGTDVNRQSSYFTNDQTHYVLCDAPTHGKRFSYLHTMTTVYIDGTAYTF